MVLLQTKFLEKCGEKMSRLIYDEKELVDSQIYKYDKFLHSRINKYTGDARTLVTYFSIDEENTTGSLGLGTHYQVLGPDSPFRYNKIENMVLLGMSPFTPEETTASQTNVRNYSISGECTTIPGTVMPKENDLFIVNYVHMNHLFRINQVNKNTISGYVVRVLNIGGALHIEPNFTAVDNHLNIFSESLDDSGNCYNLIASALVSSVSYNLIQSGELNFFHFGFLKFLGDVLFLTFLEFIIRLY